jgi:preprotein translocase subunit SecE
VIRARTGKVRATQEKGSSVSRPSFWSRVQQFFRDSWLELRKVIWPTREEVLKMTALVVVVVTIVGIFMYGWDRVLAVITNRLFLTR